MRTYHVSAAKPVFTRKRADAPASDVVQQQIAELQAAASQNAEYVKELAEQLQSTVSALQKSAELAEDYRNLAECLKRLDRHPGGRVDPKLSDCPNALKGRGIFPDQSWAAL